MLAHELIQDPVFRRAVDLLDAGNEGGLRAYLHEHPELAQQRISLERETYFNHPALLEFVAENPVRHGVLPANILAMAKVILEAGAKQDATALNGALALVCSGRVPRECGVQIPLIDLLCGEGADPDFAMPAALPHAEFEAVNALLHHGATVDLPVAAAMGLEEDVRRLFTKAGIVDRQRALALASQFGHAGIVRFLLESGEDPDGYNPAGFHAHSTPLHQAALAGHRDVVHLLVQHGARLDTKDTIWHATPAEWAKHAGKTEIEEYLLSQKTHQ